MVMVPAGVLLTVVVVGIAVSLYKVWHAWWTLWTCGGCNKAPKDCTCQRYKKIGAGL